MNPHFRIFDKSDNKYISINVDNYRFIYQGDCLLLSPATKWMKYFPFVNILNNDNFVIQHNAGLKDRNGKEIYEGDIIKYDGMSLDYPFLGVVEFWNCCFTLFEKSSEVRITLGAGLKLEIIGNIFENPELLKS